MSGGNRYKPALAYDWLTNLYDPVMRATMRETTFKTELVRQARVKPGFQVLDLGCGTATLTAMIKAAHPDADVSGLDGDSRVLSLAREKLAASGLAVRLDQGLSFDMPYPDQSFDRVLSSLLFHHLSREDKLRTLREVRRVLKPGGEVHVADWGRAPNPVMRAAFLLVQLLDGFDTTNDNVKGLLPEFLRQAGFGQVEETGRLATIFGSVSFYRAVRPD